jgi:hypothetical protein
MKKWILLAIGVATCLLFFLSCDREYDRKTKMGQFTLVERVHDTRSPFFMMAEAGGRAFAPVPTSFSRVISQHLFLADREVWDGGKTTYYIEASPTGDAVLLRSWGYNEPWHIMHVNSTSIDVEIPSGGPDSLYFHEGEDWPLDFWRWSADGRSIDAWTHAAFYFGHDHADRPYRRIWRVDALTGAARPVTICFQPEETGRAVENPGRSTAWKGTPCGAAPSHH